MDMLEEYSIDCPYCGEIISMNIDCSSGSHDFIEDCSVCCRPIELRADINADGQLATLTARRDDE